MDPKKVVSAPVGSSLHSLGRAECLTYHGMATRAVPLLGVVYI